ncbi:MAG: hypothetical protein GF320_15615, partial [Armatimonadia bacterium]|nr:hypothetical protein [Armatimonadia bacterium]
MRRPVHTTHSPTGQEEEYRHAVDLRTTTPHWLGRLYIDLRMGRDKRRVPRQHHVPSRVRRRNRMVAAVVANMALCFLIVVGAGIYVVHQASCGATPGGSIPGAVATETGGLTVRADFPEVAARVIPQGTASIGLTVTSAADGGELASGLLTPSTSELSFDALPAEAEVKLIAEAYPNADGTGVPLATGTALTTVPVGSNAQVAISMESTVATVTVSPSSCSIGPGANVDIVATAKDDQDRIVLVTGWTWASSDEAVVTVSAEGLAAGVAEGVATITATEDDTGTGAESTVSVEGGLALARPRLLISARHLELFRRNMEKPQAVHVRAIMENCGGWWLEGPGVWGVDAPQIITTKAIQARITALRWLWKEDPQDLENLVAYFNATAENWDPNADLNHVAKRYLIRVWAELYDVLYDELDEATKQKVRDKLFPYLQYIGEYTAEHHMTYMTFVSMDDERMGYLAQAGVAFYGEHEWVDFWYDFTLNYFSQYGRWSALQGDGGYGDGLMYQSARTKFHLPGVDALARFSGVDLWDPQGGWGKTINHFVDLHQPGMTFLDNSSGGAGNSWGDGSQYHTGVQNQHMWMALWYHAYYQQRGDLIDYQNRFHTVGGVPFDRWSSGIDELDLEDQCLLPYVAALELEHGIPGGSLSDRPASTAYPSTGTVAMHSNVGDPANDVLLAFKCTPYPLVATGHGNSDQNSFYLAAYNRPLVSVGGDYYSPDKSNCGATFNNNTLLFNDTGQAGWLWRTVAYAREQPELIDYQEYGDYVYAIGEA